MPDTPTFDDLKRENDALRQRLDEAEQAIRTIQAGHVGAVRTGNGSGPVESPDLPYRLLVDQMTQGAATLTTDGTILSCNRHFATLFGKSLPDLVGVSLQDFVTSDHQAYFTTLLREAQTASAQGEVLLQRGDGSLMPVFLGVNALQEGAAGLCLMVTDLTDVKRREALSALEALARSILEQAVDSIVVCDGACKVVRASHTARELAARNPLLQPFAAVYPLHRTKDDPEQPCEAENPVVPFLLQRMLRGETVHGFEACMEQPNRQTIDLLISGGPLRDDQDNILGCVVTMADITERRRMELALREAHRRKDDFLAMLGHELRNPLGPIRNSVQLMRRIGPPHPQLKQAQEIIDRQVRHMARLVEDLLDVSRISRGKVRLQLEYCDLTQIVRQAADDYRRDLEADGLKFSVAAPAEPLWVLGDSTRLNQVIGNVLHNAHKFTDPGGAVTLGVATDGDQVTLTIRDTGIGMDPQTLSRAFDTFSQADKSLERSRGGLGLGLALVKGLVEMHGGTIDAASDGPGRGSQFTIRLPLTPAPAIPPAALSHAERAVTPLRILIIEDNPDAATSLQDLLQMDGHTVHVAFSGPQGLAAARRLLPEVVLCDIGLPEMDGYEVALALRQLPELADTFLIALTGYGQEDDQRRARAAGFNVHLTKPVDFEELKKSLPLPKGSI